MSTALNETAAEMAGTSMAFEAEVWSTLENDLFDEFGGSLKNRPEWSLILQLFHTHGSG